MIDEAIVFLQRHLGRAMKSDPIEPEDRVVLPDGLTPRDGVALKQTAVSMLLLNIGEETTLRPGDLFRSMRTSSHR